MKKLSIKKIHRLIKDEKPKALAKYIRKFLPPEKQSRAEIKLDEYAHLLVKNENMISKQRVLEKIDYLILGL